MSGLTPNPTLIQKADLQVADLIAEGGYLAPEPAQRFLTYTMRRSTLLQLADVQTMRNSQKQIDRIGFLGRVLQPAQSAVALPLAQRSRPTMSRATISTSLFKAEVRLNDEVLEDNIERGTLKTTVLTELGKAIARDMEDVVINGNVASLNPFYGQFNGLLALITSNIVLAGGVSLNKDILRDLLKVLPTEFMFNKLDMRFVTSIDAEIDYRDSLANRMDAAGTRALGSDANSEATVGYTGIPVISVPMLPENLGGGNNETVVMLMNPENLVVGIQRQIKMETDRDITTGEWIVVMSLRFGVSLAEETATAMATGVTVS